jgi:CheY-like chemotaxis protein
VRILVVDDDPQILRMMARLLGSRGHEVETQQGPFGTSATALRWRPEVILLDCMMPALDGVTLSALLEKTLGEPRPKVLLWSAADEDELRRIHHDSGLPTLSKKEPIDKILQVLEEPVAAVY